jgi:hypothetical protein
MTAADASAVAVLLVMFSQVNQSTTGVLMNYEFISRRGAALKWSGG